MDDGIISFPVMQQMLRTVVDIPTEAEFEYWDLHYTEISKDIRSMHMAKAENNLSALKLDEAFMNVYDRLPIDLKSCISIMMAAKADLEYMSMNNIEKVSA